MKGLRYPGALPTAIVHLFGWQLIMQLFVPTTEMAESMFAQASEVGLHHFQLGMQLDHGAPVAGGPESAYCNH